MKITRAATWLNFAWAVLMLVALDALVLLRWQASTADGALLVLFLAALAYAAVAFAAVEDHRWALAVSFLAAIGLLVFWLPWVVLNFNAFLKEDPLYQNSPGTILVVAVNALIFCLPALLVVLAYTLRFRVLLQHIRHHDAAHT
jgi:hypothetical protein